METKKCACFEITSDEIKLLIGYCLGDKPVVLYSAKRPIPSGLIHNGVIVNEEGLQKELSALTRFKDEKMKVDVNLHEICLVLAPWGLRVYKSNKMTVMSNADKLVTKLDVAILIQQGKNESLHPGEETVDIIPTSFKLSDGSVYANPPLGVKSDYMEAELFMHALPKAASSDYLNLATHCGCHTKKAVDAPYCEALLFAEDETLPKAYILLDIGERYTAATLVANCNPYYSQSIPQGGADLSEFLAAKFGISFEEADKIKRIFGYSERQASYLPPLGKGIKEGSLLEEEFNQKDLNKAMEEYFEGYFAKLNGAFLALSESAKRDISSFDIVLTGGGSKLAGMPHFFASHLPSHALFFPSKNYLGVDAREFSACLGMVIAASHYTGSMEDNQHGVANVTRVSEKKEKKGEKRTSAHEDSL